MVEENNQHQKKHKGVIAQYTDHKLSELRDNPVIEALPPLLENNDFIKKVTVYPEYNDSEISLEVPYRRMCVRRLSRYFDPQSETLELQYLISGLIMEGYIGRNPLNPQYNIRSNEIYEAIKNKDDKELKDYISKPIASSCLTLIGPSGIGKTTNLLHILNLYPQVIFHPNLNCHQIVWLRVDCPHAGSLKDLCSYILQEIDRLLDTNYSKKFTSRNSTEYMLLAQALQVSHTHHVGVLVIDEIQNLVKARRNEDDIIRFLVRMSNIIGIPVIRAGTNETLSLLQTTFCGARRGIGEGSIIWDRMAANAHWDSFLEGLWEYQWTQTFTELTDDIRNLFYYETQGIIDIAIKLYKMVQWRAMSNGGAEEITTDLIKEVAKEGLFIVRPMLDSIREGDLEWMLKYKDIAPIDTDEYERQCKNRMDAIKLQELRNASRQIKNRTSSPQLNYIIAELIKLNIELFRAKECAEKVVLKNEDKLSVDELLKEAYLIALEGNTSKPKVESKQSPKEKKRTPNYQTGDLRQIIVKSIENSTSAYLEFQQVGYIGNMLEDYFHSI